MNEQPYRSRRRARIGGRVAGAGAGGARASWWVGEGGAARAERRCRARCAGRADGGGGRRGRRARRAGTIPSAAAVRHGHEAGEVTLGGRRVQVERPRVRSADGAGEVPLRDLRAFRRPRSADAGRARADARRRLDAPLPAHAGAGRRARSRRWRARRRSRRSSREFVARTRENLERADEPPPRRRRLAVLMLDGIELKGRTNVVALGITTEGVKIPLGLWEGSTENADRRDRAALRPGRPRPRPRAGRALRDRRRQGAPQGGPRRARRPAPVQRCIRHKERNVLDHLPERDRPGRQAAAAPGLGARRPRPRARASCERSPASSTARHPGAAASLREGHGGDAHRSPGSGSRGSLKRTLAVDQPVRVDDRDASAAPAATSSAGSPATWRSAGPPPACSKPNGNSGKIIGYRDLAKLALAIERDLDPPNRPPPRPRRPLRSSPPEHHTGTAVAKFHDERDILCSAGVEWHFGFHGLPPADAVAPTMSSAASDVATAANLIVMELTTTGRTTGPSRCENRALHA